MKFSCYFVLNHSGTSEWKFFWTHSCSLRLTRNCPWINSVTAFTSLISTMHRPHGKHRLYCWWRHRLRGLVFTVSLLRNGLHNPVLPPLLSADDIENTVSSIVACWTVFTSCCLATLWSNPLQYFRFCVQACNINHDARLQDPVVCLCIKFSFIKTVYNP
jgi:hypothetical protein